VACAFLWRGPGVGRAGAPRLSIAVLPFRNLDEDRTKDYLADAITDDLTTDLSHIPASVVIARESADVFKDRVSSAKEVGRILNVRYLLEGSVRSKGSMLRVNAQLVESATNVQLWSDHIEIAQSRLDEAQQTIERRIANALDVTLSEIESARSKRDRPGDPNALDLFLQAKSILDRDDGLAAHQRAQRLLEHATVLQPTFAEAWAELGWTLLDKVRLFDDPDDQADFDEAKIAASRAVGLTPQSALALATQARYYAVDRRCADAIYSARAALAMDANSIRAQSTLANCALALAQLDVAGQSLQSIIRLDPTSQGAKLRLISLGYVVLLLGNPGDAIDVLHRAIAGDPDPQPGGDNFGRAENARLLLIAALEMDGRHREAEAAYRAYDRNWPHRSVWRLAGYYPKAVVALPGFRHILDALLKAGMPYYARVDGRSAGASSPWVASGDFAESPDFVKDVITIDAAKFAALRLQHPAPVVLDVSRQINIPKDAACETPADARLSDLDRAMLTIRSRRPALDADVIVLSDGWYGSRGFDLATNLVASGVSHVYWLKGGEEALAEAGEVGQDCRPQ